MLAHNTERITEVNTTSGAMIVMFAPDMDTSKEAIGRRLEEAREKLDLRREDVAERLGSGFSVSAIQAHENGRNEATIAKLERYARLYRVPFIWLLTGKSTPTEAAQAVDQDALSDAIFSAAHAHAEATSITEQQLAEIAQRAATFYERFAKKRRERAG